MRLLYGYLFVFLILLQSLFSQTPKIDSLRTVISGAHACNCASDTTLAKNHLAIARLFRKVSEFDSSMKNGQQALSIALKINHAKLSGDAYNLIGEVYRAQGEIETAMQFYEKAISNYKKINDKRGISICYNNMGLVYDKRGKFTEALDCYFKSLKLKDEIKDRNGKASTFINMGNLYYRQEWFTQAKNSFRQGIEIYKETNDTYGLSAGYFSLGNVCSDEKRYPEALEHYSKALALKKQLGDKQGIANLFNNLGNIAFYSKQYDSALVYYERYIKMKEEIKDLYGLGSAYGNIGRTYVMQGKIEKARECLHKALDFALKEDIIADIESTYSTLSDFYELTKDYGKSLEYYKKYIIYKDSLFNEENTKKGVELEMNYEFEKKTAQAKLEQEKRDAVAAAERRRQRIILFAISAFGLLVLGFALFAYRSFLQKKRANKEILHQKNIIEQKQKEILDSIYYARRIQRSLMPSEKNFEKLLRKRYKS